MARSACELFPAMFTVFDLVDPSPAVQAKVRALKISRKTASCYCIDVVEAASLGASRVLLVELCPLQNMYVTTTMIRMAYESVSHRVNGYHLDEPP